jgi:hypothetical protein
MYLKDVATDKGCNGSWRIKRKEDQVRLRIDGEITYRHAFGEGEVRFAHRSMG